MLVTFSLSVSDFSVGGSSPSSSTFFISSSNNRSIVPDTMVLLYSRHGQENDFRLLLNITGVEVKVGLGCKDVKKRSKGRNFS